MTLVIDEPLRLRYIVGRLPHEGYEVVLLPVGLTDDEVYRRAAALGADAILTCDHRFAAAGAFYRQSVGGDVYVMRFSKAPLMDTVLLRLMAFQQERAS